MTHGRALRVALPVGLLMAAMATGMYGCAGHQADQGKTVAVPNQTDQEVASRFRNDSHLPPQARAAAVTQMQTATRGAQMQQRREMPPPSPSPSAKK